MLSIVIPTFNRADLLRRCLTAVLQHAPARTEIVVVDDASPAGAAGQVVQAFPGVRLIRHQRRRGFAAAANTGICATRGDVIELLNDDTEVRPGWADAALRWFDDPVIGAVAPLTLIWPDGEYIDSAGDRYYLGGVAGKRGHGQPLRAEFLRPQLVFGASASTAFYRRAAFDQVGLFPESFTSYFEDVDLAHRLQRGGWRTMYEPASQVLHHVGSSHRAASRRLLEQQSCNEERIFWRNTRGLDLWRALPRHVAVLAGKALRRWREGRLLPWLVGRVRGLAEVRALWGSDFSNCSGRIAAMDENLWAAHS